MADSDIETAREQRPSRLHTFSALRNVNFRYLWVSSAFISAGNQVQQSKLPAFRPQPENPEPGLRRADNIGPGRFWNRPR